ncbi:thialysine N-epsilon-acetyltransferase-like [Amblyomma americanum]
MTRIRKAQVENCHKIAEIMRDRSDIAFTDVDVIASRLQKNGFGEDPVFISFLAEDDDAAGASRIIGYAMLSRIYSTWQGKSLRLGDLYIVADRRRQGVGTDLLRTVMKRGAQEFDFKDDAIAIEDLKANAFGEWPLVHILIAEDSGGSIGVPCPPLCANLLPAPPLVGCAVYSFVFSTWGGRTMMLDGVHVATAYRGKGVGSALLRAIFKEASQTKCNELVCNVLAKNEAFINLMRRHGAIDQEREKGWHLFEMDGRAITLLTQEQPWTPLSGTTSKSSLKSS